MKMDDLFSRELPKATDKQLKALPKVTRGVRIHILGLSDDGLDELMRRCQSDHLAALLAYIRCPQLEFKIYTALGEDVTEKIAEEVCNARMNGIGDDLLVQASVSFCRLLKAASERGGSVGQLH